MKWFKYDESGGKFYAPQLVKENGQYIKPSSALLESLGYQLEQDWAEPDQTESAVEGIFSHGEPCFVEENPQQVILSGLQALDNSIVMQLAGWDNVAEDVSFIQCFYGHQMSHVEAAKKALLLNLRSEPKFGEWIFTEAQVDSEREFEWLRDYGVKYEFVPIPEESKWMFLKWPLWNFGARKASKDKFAFADADVVFCNRDWAAKVSRAIGKFDIISLSRKCYYAEQSFKDRDAGLDAYKGLLDTAGAAERGHVGFTFGFNRKFLSEFGGFGCSIQKHGDVESWKRARKIAKAKDFKIGCAEGVCCHVSHGFLSDRKYDESKEVFRKIGEVQESFVSYELGDVLPKWNEANPRCDEIRGEFTFVYFDQFCQKEGQIVLDRRFSLEQVRAAVQKKIDDSVEDETNFVRPIVQEADLADVEGIAVVQCLFGTDEEQVTAAKKAVGLLAASGQRPSEWVFVEAQYGEELAQMKQLCERLGIRHLFKRMTHRSDGIFLKNALWNIGARATKAPKLVFIDSDVAFSNAGWLENISRSLDEFEVVQPFSEIWWAEELANDGERRYFPAAFRTSFARELKERGFADAKRYVPGYALAMVRWFFDQIGGIDVLPSNGSDAWFWLRHLPPECVLKSDLGLPILGDAYGYDLTPGRTSYAGNVAFHVRHGQRGKRKYHETLYFNQKFCDDVNDTLDWDCRSDELPVFKDEQLAKAHQACVLRCRSGDEDVRDIFEDEKFKVYPRVKESSKVVFLTALNNESGREILDTRIVKTHKFLIDKYCSTPHEYWCITNEKIDGVDTIPFELDPNREIIGWNAQYELFRNLFPGRPIMTLDFDCVPTRPFTLHDIPDGYFSMMYQTTSTPESVPIVIFNTGTTYFKGDFSFIFEKFKEFIRAKIPPTMYFTTIQDVVAYESAMRGISVHSVSKAVDVMLVKLDHPSYKKAYGQVRNHDFVHYLGYVKPWSVDRLKRLKLQHLVPGEFMNMESGAF